MYLKSTTIVDKIEICSKYIISQYGLNFYLQMIIVNKHIYAAVLNNEHIESTTFFYYFVGSTIHVYITKTRAMVL